MEIVGSRFDDHVYDCTALTDIRSEIAGLHLEFINGFYRWLQDFEADLLLIVVESVEQEIVVCSHQAVHLDGSVAAFVFRDTSLLHNACRPLIHSWTEIGELQKVATV